jgi:hypothetical protein
MNDASEPMPANRSDQTCRRCSRFLACRSWISTAVSMRGLTILSTGGRFRGHRDRSRQRKILDALRSGVWREAILAAVSAWNRNQVRQVITAVILTWLLGATALYLAERRVNSDFATWGDALWGVWVVLFSGMDQDPKTTAGRLVMMVLLVLGVGLAYR